MPYCIEYYGNDGKLRYLDEKSRPSDLPYFWKKQTSAESVIKGRVRDGIKYRCRSADLMNAQPVITNFENASNFEVKLKERLLDPAKLLDPVAESECNTAQTDSDTADPKIVADAFRIISKNIRNLDQMIDTCRNEVSKEDRITQDILHYVEFEKCDAVMISKIFRILKNSRIERRKNKDLLIFLELLDKVLSEDDRKRIMDTVDLYDSRMYSPKELHELFENKI